MSSPGEPDNLDDLIGKPEPARPPVPYGPSPDVRLKKPVYLRPPSAPEAIHRSAVLERELRRSALFGVAGRFAAVAAFVVIGAMLFIVISPVLRQSDANSTSSEIIAKSMKSEVAGSTKAALPPSSQDQNEAKPALAEFQGVLASTPAKEPVTSEQPPQLLQQFLQWRRKADAAGAQ